LNVAGAAGGVIDQIRSMWLTGLQIVEADQVPANSAQCWPATRRHKVIRNMVIGLVMI
jgi:hypothetical protein